VFNFIFLEKEYNRMKLITQVPLSNSSKPIDYHSKILLMGSCFAESMGGKLEYYKFQSVTNPFGIIFNPISIEKMLQRVVHKKPFTEADIFFHNAIWQCYEVHSELSHTDKNIFLDRLNEVLFDFNKQINSSTHCLITYGTSWVYQLKSTNEMVANCHKVPQSQFNKILLTIASIEQSIQNTVSLMQSVNPSCQVTFTISPVRHIKDGFVENQRSKAHLIAALHPSLNYFPSYEIMMDELRDYRFYTSDLLHPNELAIDYIWERFCESSISESSNKIMETVASIQKGLTHRAFNPDSENHKKFLNELHQKINKLQEEFPFMKF